MPYYKYHEEPTVSWRVNVSLDKWGDWQAELLRYTKFLCFPERTVPLTGLFAGPSLWFRPMDERLAIVKERLLKLGAKLDALQNAENEALKRYNSVPEGR